MAEATNTTLGTITLTGDLDGSAQTPSLRATGVLPGTYNVANLVVNNKGLVIDVVQGDPEVLPCATTGECGLVVVGDNITVNSGQISIPLATTSNKGVVKVGSGFRIDGCVLEVDYPKATTTTKGLVKIDAGGSIQVDGSGNISVPHTANGVLGLVQYGTSVGQIGTIGGKLSLILPVATSSVLGAVKSGIGFPVDIDGVLSFDGQLPPATESSLGGMRAGAGLDTDTNGLVWVDLSEVGFPIASDTVLGMIKIGTGLDIDGSSLVTVDPTEILASGASAGCISVGSNITLTAGQISIPNATTSTKGVVQIDNTSLDFTSSLLGFKTASTTVKGILQIGTGTGLSVSSGVLSFQEASAANKGSVRVGTNFSVAAGGISVPSCSPSVLGVAWIGTNISVSSGTISIPNATTSTKGVVQISNTSDLSGSYLTITSGTVSLVKGSGLTTDATTSTKGVVQIQSGTGLSINTGVLSGENATTSTKGVVRVGSNINVTSGTISVPISESTTTFGVIKSADANNISISSGLVDVGSNIPKLASKNSWTMRNGSSGTMAGSGLNLFPCQDLQTKTLSSNLTLSFSSLPSGTIVRCLFIQDATGGRTITFPSQYKFNKPVSYNTAANSQTLLTCLYLSGSVALCYLEKL